MKRNTTTKLVLGAKYVPHSKTVPSYGSLEASIVWRKAQDLNQPYLYYTGKDTDSGEGDHHCFNYEPYNNEHSSGDFFLPEDVTPYQEVVKLIVGNKYVPHSKNAGHSRLDGSSVWKTALKRSQPYLYFTGLSDGDLCFDYEYNDVCINGDHFLESDVTPYQEEQAVKKYDCIYDQIMAESTLKVGDTVRITHSVPSNDLGWNNSWVSEMNEQVGKKFEIKSIDNYGVFLKLKDGKTSYAFPVHVLEFVKSGPEFIEVVLTPDYTAVVYPDRIVVGCQTISQSVFNELTTAVMKMKK